MGRIFWEKYDLRDEIAEYEKSHRFWPRSGSVSKPWDDPIDFKIAWACYRGRRDEEWARRIREDYEAEQAYKHAPRYRIACEGGFKFRLSNLLPPKEN